MTTNTLTHYPTCLITMLQQRSPIFIATYGSKFDTKSGGAWVLSTHHGNLLSHGSNLDYDIMDNIHPH